MATSLVQRLGYSFILFFCGAAFAGTTKRVHLVRFVSEGYPAYKNKVSSLDVGVSGDNVNCELLDPQKKTKAAAARWAPADLYTNAQTAAEFQGAGARQGEKDIFFVGDDNNRNGAGQSYQATLVADTSLTNSMDFENKVREKDSAQYGFRFTRTGILYQTIIRIEAKPSKEGCTALAYVCDRVEGAGCAAGGWKQFRRAIVTVDVKGGLMDSFKPPASDKERNDIKELRLELSEVDGEGYPKGSPYEKVVAKK